MDELFKDYYEEQEKLETVERNCKTCAEEDNYEHLEYCERCIGCDRWKPKYTEKAKMLNERKMKEKMSMDEEVVFIKQKSMGELILNNLFSEETEKFYNNCVFTSDRQAFMQGMNYAVLLCVAKLEQYPAIIHHEPPKEE